MAHQPDDFLCDECHKPVGFEYQVDPRLWKHVTDSTEDIEGIDGGPGYLCLTCFAVKALTKGITEFRVEKVFTRTTEICR